MDKENFKHYLEVCNVGQNSRQKYLDQAMHAITEALQRLKLLGPYETVYDIQSASFLRKCREVLRNDPDFMAKDKKGHQMYSAGFNHLIKFAEGLWINEYGNGLASFVYSPKPVYNATSTIQEEVPNRDRILVMQTLEAEHFICQAHPEHLSFPEDSGIGIHPYMEGHHLIPLKYQKEFSYSLDTYANIISLCPTCHRQIHFGLKEDRKKMINNLFEEREGQLQDSGIRTSKHEIWELLELA